MDFDTLLRAASAAAAGNLGQMPPKKKRRPRLAKPFIGPLDKNQRVAYALPMATNIVALGANFVPDFAPCREGLERRPDKKNRMVCQKIVKECANGLQRGPDGKGRCRKTWITDKGFAEEVCHNVGMDVTRLKNGSFRCMPSREQKQTYCILTGMPTAHCNNPPRRKAPKRKQQVIQPAYQGVMGF